MRVMKFFLGFATALLTVVAVGFLVVWSGIVSVSAIGEGGAIDKFLKYASARSIARHAGSESNPFANDPEAMRVGLAHYKENCLTCHAASGIDRSEFARGLNPAPPRLAAPSTRTASDGELFWVVSNGIRSTGMPAFSPTHSEDEIWKIITFVRHLPDLTPGEVEVLKSTDAGKESHHHDESEH